MSSQNGVGIRSQEWPHTYFCKECATLKGMLHLATSALRTIAVQSKAHGKLALETLEKISEIEKQKGELTNGN